MDRLIATLGTPTMVMGCDMGGPPAVPVVGAVPGEFGIPAAWQVTVAPTGMALPADQVPLLGLIVQVPTFTPDGRLLTEQVPLVAVAEPLLVQLKLPE